MRRPRFDKKKIADFALSLLVLAGTLCLAWMGLTEKRTLPASASPGITLGDIPDDACVIIIDAGHGGFDGGAVGTETGAIEAELNLSIAKTLADELTKSGFYVIMTRSGDGALGDTKSEDMKARGEIIGLERADAVVSIHINKFRDRTVSGPMVFYMKGSEAGKSLADSIMFSLCEKLGRAPRYTNPEDLFVLRVPKAPSVLIECGFLSNAADEALLVTPEHRENIAKAAAEGIKNYFAQMKSGDPR